MSALTSGQKRSKFLYWQSIMVETRMAKTSNEKRKNLKKMNNKKVEEILKKKIIKEIRVRKRLRRGVDR